MKVLHLLSAIAPRYGGTSTVIFPLCEALHALPDIEVELATTDADGAGMRIDRSNVSATFPVHVFPRILTERWQYAPQMGKWIRANAARFDVVHSHAIWTYAPGMAAGCARRAGKPYVVSPHGMLSPYTWRTSKWLKRASWWLRERTNIRGAAGFHVTSDEERQEVLQLGVTAPVEVIPLGIGSDAWETPVEPGWLREQCPQAGDRPILLFLSRLHPKKGITEFLLPALALLKTDVFLAIAGGEDGNAPGFAHEIENEIGRRGLQRKVALLGPIAPNRRWAAFDGADLFVLPSHAENFGIVVPESMARGKPVVVTTGVQFGVHVTASGAGGGRAARRGRISRQPRPLALGSRAKGPRGRRRQEIHPRTFHLASDGGRIGRTVPACHALYETRGEHSDPSCARSDTLTRICRIAIRNHGADPHL